MQQRRRSHGYIAAEAGADEHQVARQLLAELDQSRDTLAWIVEPAVIDGVRFVSFAAGDFGERGDLSSPGPALLAMGEDHVPSGS